MRISLKYLAFLLFLKKQQNLICRLLQIIGGALWVSMECSKGPFVVESGVVSKYKWQIGNNTCD